MGWVSHGLPENGYNYEGESLVNRNGNHSQWVLAPNNHDFRVPSACPPTSFRASCSGFLNEVSLYTDHHFTKRFDAYAGIAYSNVSGGLAIAIPHGPGVPYNYNNNVAPTVGARFTF